MDSFDYLIVGAGFAGATCARQLADAGKRVLLIDQRNHIGGNAYDYYDDDGVLVHKYGPHIFHTNSYAVFNFLTRFTEWRRYEHRVLTCWEDQKLPMPINRATLRAFGGDLEAAKAALIRPYSRKQWGCDIEELDPSVLARIQPRDSEDARYFLDRYQVMPLYGYTRLFARMLAHPKISIMLQTRWDDIAEMMPLDPETERPLCEVIFTGPIDQYFDYALGKLPYRSAQFELLTTRSTYLVQPVAVLNFPSADVLQTRVTEFRHLTGQIHEKTVRCYETPCADGEPYWPVPTAANLALAKDYKQLAAKTPGVSFCGRLGTYQYLNIDQAVAQALTLSKRLLTGGHDADAAA